MPLFRRASDILTRRVAPADLAMTTSDWPFPKAIIAALNI
jgi:hypothetical protein